MYAQMSRIISTSMLEALPEKKPSLGSVSVIAERRKQTQEELYFRVQGCLSIYSEFQANLSYIRPCLRRRNTDKENSRMGKDSLY